MIRKLLAEFIGTAFLLIGVVGSGIMAESLAGDNIALALLANAIATGCILYAIITTLGPVSGAHFNPAVTLAFAIRREHDVSDVLPYVVVQIAGGIIGVWACHLMFDLPILQLSNTDRTGVNQWASEIIATFGLLLVIFGGIKHRPDAVPPLVGLYITGAYWFTSSTSFANPAVTIARGFSDTFAGINPAHISMFILTQIVGVGVAAIVLPILFPKN
ncbi:MIP/aquaporin family protein [Pseudohalocynthiibacter aestuariivivens]|jgi:glycerol uptake facilitator-like aquaporin|uniref:MIP/aquaporin family protein n=1 Tax=Pseudohalocynthiibacter aestuariivivens TaxID=1591409 RepID=A0ABV5JFV8_9RHOB|nr:MULTISPECIES: MIP/aquaporin family protein [Pseudohalocynthiibacter]MBS9716309.1 aquaporin family protein [Pseudohalocynthiibacter aestuariivivens]MCK0100883.1 aquaporin family protein [Pseudohalocynthiibacter sp. F2068]